MGPAPMSHTLLHVEVLGQPVPKARPRITRSGHAYTPKKTKEYEKLIQSHLPQITIDQPIHVSIVAIFQRPQRLKRKTDPQLLIPHTKRPDLDNVVKSVLDSLNLILSDDSIVCSINAQKFYAEIHQQPRTIITINTL
jgi:Holliday junction resolvase RusA-like endonuclease